MIAKRRNGQCCHKWIIGDSTMFCVLPSGHQCEKHEYAATVMQQLLEEMTTAPAASGAPSDAEDAARFRYWFSPEAKTVDINGYLQGIRESWSLDQWRAFCDSARGGR